MQDSTAVNNRPMPMLDEELKPILSHSDRIGAPGRRRPMSCWLGEKTLPLSRAWIDAGR